MSSCEGGHPGADQGYVFIAASEQADGKRVSGERWKDGGQDEEERKAYSVMMVEKSPGTGPGGSGYKGGGCQSTDDCSQ